MTLFRLVTILLLTLDLSTASASAFTYAPLVLGDGYCPNVYDVNRSGQIAATCDGFASIWTNGSKVTLLAPDGISHSQTWALNNNGQVIGTSSTGPDSSFGYHATVWTGSTAQDLGTLGGKFSRALGINDAGIVVGRSDLSQPGQWHATRWDGTQITDLGTLGGTNSTAISINNAGTIAGISRIIDDAGSHATIWSGSTITDLGTLGGTNSWANAINDQGWIAGDSDLPGNNEHHAFLWNGNTMLDLGTLGGAQSYANEISSDGSILGNSETTNGEVHATLWANGATIDLNDFLDAQSRAQGIVLTTTFGFDGNGSIYGQQINTKTYKSSYYVLIASPTAIPEPSTLWLALLAALAVAAVMFHRRSRNVTAFQSAAKARN